MGCDDYYLVPQDTRVRLATDAQQALRHWLRGVTLKPRWRVCKRNGAWRIYDRQGSWYDTDDTLVAAHTYATQLAVADELFADGGLTRLRTLRSLAQRTALRACR